MSRFAGLACLGGLTAASLLVYRQNQQALVAAASPLRADAFAPLTLLSVAPLSHNTSIFRFGPKIGLPACSALLVRAQIDGKDVVRPYTPVELDGHFDLVVKNYPTGVMSRHIHSLKPGDVLEMKGPLPKFTYVANEHAHIGMLAGGSGLTPMLQIIDAVTSNPDDKTRLSLVFANASSKDIFLKDRLEELEKKHPQLTVFYSVDDDVPAWSMGQKGYINTDLVKRFMPKPSEGKVFVCGPPPMMAALSGPKGPKFTQGDVSGLLGKLGYTSADVFKF